jgi:Protein of unknown function (DUF3300)
VSQRLIRTIAGALAVFLAGLAPVEAQDAAPAPPAEAPHAPQAAPAAQAQPAPQAPVFRTEEIDQMVAPIALYPDQLLAQVLMASTYPLEVVKAERWLEDPANAKLSGDPLAAALEQQSWDPSVKSLVPFPAVLKMMNDKLDWTQRLGDAFLAQQADVMSSVQRLRRQAQDAGTLKSTEQQKVVVEQPKDPAAPQTQTIVIQPADPQVVYVPTYNPTTAYGTWPYPSYPPAYYPPPPAYYPVGTALVSGMAFATGVAVVGSLWGWGDCNWGHGDVTVNSNRYNTINSANIQSGRAAQLSGNANTWRHDPAHRAGVAYRDPATRQAYQRQPAGSSAATRNYRGYDGTQRAAAQGTARPAAGAGTAQAQRRAGGTQAQRQAGGAQGQRQAGSAQARRQGGAGANRAASGSSTPRQAGAGARASAPQRQQAAAFQGMGNGSQVRAQADRGRASRQSAAASTPRANASAGGGMRAGGGGGARAGGGGGGRRR